jgi:hypothetical protein
VTNNSGGGPPQRPKSLRGTAAIRGFFRRNETPVYFVSPTAFNLLGIDRWIRNFTYVNYLDSFDGAHPRVFVPKEREERELQSMEEINNYPWPMPRSSISYAEGGQARRSS